MVGFVGLPLLAGAVGTGLTRAPVSATADGTARLAPPAGAPLDMLLHAPWPGLAFALLWAMVGGSLGLSAWLIWCRGRRQPLTRPAAARALRVWGWQVLGHATWLTCFLGLSNRLPGLLMMTLLLGLVVATLQLFRRIDRRAGWLLLPSGAWVCYAVYLTVGMWWMSRA